MASLRVGYDLFAGSSQAGVDASIPGNVQVETNEAKAYVCQIQRLSDNQFYNHVTPGWQAGIPTEAQDLAIPGSSSVRGIMPAIRRLEFKIPTTVLAGITSAGCVINVYPTGGTAAVNGVELTLAYKPTT